MPMLLIAPRRQWPASREHAWRIPGASPVDPAGRRRRVEPACPVERELERWTAGRLGSVAHERRVVDLATDLFDVTRPLHGLDADDLRLLRRAAIVHDVGRSVCDETHHLDGARLLRNDRRLPLAAADRRHLMFLTAHHRGKVPAADRDDVLDPSDDHGRLRLVLALLRAADGLDNRALARRDDAPPHVVFGLAHGRLGTTVLRVTCTLRTVSAKARRVYGKRKKFRLLAELLGCEVRVELMARKPLRAVA